MRDFFLEWVRRTRGRSKIINVWWFHFNVLHLRILLIWCLGDIFNIFSLLNFIFYTFYVKRRCLWMVLQISAREFSKQGQRNQIIISKIDWVFISMLESCETSLYLIKGGQYTNILQTHIFNHECLYLDLFVIVHILNKYS